MVGYFRLRARGAGSAHPSPAIGVFEHCCSNPCNISAALPVLVERLITNYARFLDLAPSGQYPDYLIWEAVDVREARSTRR